MEAVILEGVGRGVGSGTGEGEEMAEHGHNGRETSTMLRIPRTLIKAIGLKGYER